MSAGMGRHLLIEMYECDPHALDDAAVIENAMLSAAQCCGTTIIHHFFHRFSPQGVSGIIVIAESHMSVHTWPEHRYAAIDLFTCGSKTLPDACLESMRNAFRCTKVSQQTIIRGEAVGHDEAAGLELPRIAEPDSNAMHNGKPAITEVYQPLHPEIFRYDADFVARFIAPEVATPQTRDVKRVVRHMAEQIYVFPLFTPEFCRLIIEEAEHHGGWVTVLEKTEEAHSVHEDIVDLIEPDTTLSWQRLPGMPEVYGRIIRHHVQPVVETLWQTFKLQKWDMPAVRKFELNAVNGMALHYDNEIIGMIGYLNTGFQGGGTFFPRWNLAIGRSGDVTPGSVAVYPGGVSHEHMALPITAGVRYMLSNALY